MESEEYERMFRQETNFWWYIVLQNLILSYIKSLQFSDKKIKILDAGCGTGRMVELLSVFGDVRGIDISDEAIYYSKIRSEQNCRVQDLNSWIVEPSSFDIIICNDVLVHKAIKSDYLVLTKFYDALKENGILITNNAAFRILRRKHDTIVHGIRRYKKNEFVAMTNKIGFKKILATYRLPHLFLIIVLSKLYNRLFHIKNQAFDNKPIPSCLNRLLILIGKFENKLILLKIPIPLGSSLFLISKKLTTN